MDLQHYLLENGRYKNLSLIAYQIVEGFISGMHKSPFHGFSSEFSEHKIYNTGESTKNIDWKLYARTEKLYTKQYEEETNMRCHIIIDNSPSMHYPQKPKSVTDNKIGYAVLGAAVLMQLLKKQRDAAGLSVFSENYDYYAPEKGSDRHYRMLYNQLEQLTEKPYTSKKTNISKFLHQIAENVHKRSMIVLFTDFFQMEDDKELFDALEHLKYNNHKVVVFHIYDREKEFYFEFSDAPKKFVDIETGETVQAYAENVQELYQEKVREYFNNIKLTCSKYKIKYIPIAIQDSFENIITSYLIEKQQFR
ncbi:MAG: DUF58 domain-containing protein [Flavobacteriales bacterium]|nr:DUF58 domain-containing protein [Flavobacteriales bacterium]